jgi:hypothetical protein
MNIFLKIMILFFLSDTLYSKSIINQYIFSSTNDATIEETTKLFDKYKYKKNYLDKVRLSAGYSEFADVESKYAIRFYPKSISKIELEESNYKIIKKQIQNRLYDKDIKNLKSKYDIVLEAFYQKRFLKNIELLQEAYKNGIQSSQLQIEETSDVQKLSKLKGKLKQLNLMYIKKAYNYKNTLMKIQVAVTNSTLKDINNELENYDLLDSYEIINLISKYDYNIANKLNKKYLYEEELLQNRYKLKKLKKDITLESIEVKYDDSKKVNRNLSIGINVEIPIGETNSNSLLNSKLKQIILHDKIAENKLDGNIKIAQLIKDIKFLHNYKNELQEYNYKEQNFYNEYAKLEKTDPSFILDLKKRELDYAKDIIKAKYSIHKKYLQLLYLTNLLSIDANTQIFNQNGS